MSKQSPATTVAPSSPLAKGGEFELAISPAKLADIIGTKTRVIELDPVEAYDKLSPANQIALAHLVKAAVILDDVFLKQDHPDNIHAADMLWQEATKPTSYADAALDALTLYTIHNGMEGPDMYGKSGKPLRLFKNKKLAGTPGKAFYPQDLTAKELKSYLLKHPEEASAILGNNTIVRRDGDKLVAEPYSVVFREEMQGAGRQLLLAAQATDHEGLANYLRLQAQALVNDSDPKIMFEAEKAWAELQGAPLDITVARETYNDELSAQMAADPQLCALFKTHGITARKKDSFGVLVGIVDMESQALIQKLYGSLPDFLKEQPLLELYKSQANEVCNIKFVDVHIVALTGDYAALRGGMTIAAILPNDDKLAEKLVGRRVTFQYQIRSGADPDLEKPFLDALVAPEQQHLYDIETCFPDKMGHEITHYGGPKATEDGRDKKAALGAWGDTLEECKANNGAIIMTGIWKRQGKVTPEQADQIAFTWMATNLPKRQPTLSEAHRTAAIMELNYYREKGAITFEKDGKLTIVPEKMADTAQQMWADITRIQFEGNAETAKKFGEKYAAWNAALQYAVDEQRKLPQRLYRQVVQPMRDRLETLELPDRLEAARPKKSRAAVKAPQASAD